MERLSYNETTGGVVFTAPNKQVFPVSSKAAKHHCRIEADDDSLEGVMFTVRSEPTEESVLDSVMFTVRSEPTEESVLDSVMFTVRSEPTSDDVLAN